MARKNSIVFENIISQSFHEILSNSFKRYAKYIIQDRALPDIRDGLKPVQRRILYAMLGLGLMNNKPYKKSARTVGEVIGKYHPHGDSSIYEALVRMSQEWKNNLVLIDMQGNKGSIDGDPAAAMRYTEARLSTFSERLLVDIDKKNVRFVKNFDDSETEPTVLPALLPNLLINGANGIASGYATNIPPHNPTEVIDAAIFRLENPECTLSQVCHIVKGPDFPTAGIIQGSDGIRNIYKTGQGKINIVSQTTYDPVSNAIIVKSIPFETNKSAILKSIDEIISTGKVSGIVDVIDSSDQHGVNIIIKLDKSVSQEWENIKNYLLKNTMLQIAYSANMVAIIAGKPVKFGLLQYLDVFLEHALTIVVKTAEYNLTNASRRLEIVSGLIKATEVIDRLIKTIRASQDRESAKQNIIQQFGFTELQADAIVQLRLYSLTNADATKLMEEKKQLELTVDQMNKILHDETYRKSFLKEKLLVFRNDFMMRRKSKIEAEISKFTVSEENLIKKSNVYVSVSRDGYIKSTLANFKLDVDIYSKYKLKENDILVSCLETNNNCSIVLVTSCGNFITVPIYKIKEIRWKELGTHLNYLTPLSDNEKIINMFVSDGTQKNDLITIISKNGLIKSVPLETLMGAKITKTSVIMKFKTPDDQIVSACRSRDASASVYLFTHTGRAVKYELNEVPQLGPKSSGVKAIGLSDDDFIATGVVLANSITENMHFCIIANTGAKRISPQTVLQAKRGNHGKLLFTKALSGKNGIITVQSVGRETYLNLVQENGNNVIVPASSIPISDNASRLSYWKEKVHCAYAIELKTPGSSNKTLFD